MAKIVKILEDGIQLYPQTITDAIADVRARTVLSDWMKTIEKKVTSVENRLSAIELIIGSGSTSEYIDNLYELLKWFSGTTEDIPFVELVKKYVEAHDAEDIPETTENEETEDYPTFEDMFGENNVPHIGT